MSNETESSKVEDENVKSLSCRSILKRLDSFAQRQTEFSDVIFSDGPDPDNFVFVLACIRMVQRSKDNPVHIVVTGRPVNFTSKSFRPEDIKASGKSTIKLLPRGENEKDDPTDGELVTLDTICRFDRFLRAAGEEGNYILYNGLVSSHAPVSHKMHALDFLMDRASLVRDQSVEIPIKGEVLEVCTETGWTWGVVTRVPRHKRWADIYCSAQSRVFKKVDVHFLRRPISNDKSRSENKRMASCLADDVITIEEYRAFQLCHNKMNPEARRSSMRRLMRRQLEKSKIESLKSLCEILVKSSRKLRFQVGGPLTALDKLMDMGGSDLVLKIAEMNMMMGAWSNNKPGSFNLFKNQFNVGADPLAAKRVLIDRLSNLSVSATIRLIPTETCKSNNLKFSSESLRKMLCSEGAMKEEDLNVEARTILKMYNLWWNIGGKRDMFCFDINAALITRDSERSMLEWKSACAVMDSDGSTLYIREKKDEDSDEEKTKKMLLCATGVVSDPYADRHFKGLKRTFETRAPVLRRNWSDGWDDKEDDK